LRSSIFCLQAWIWIHFNPINERPEAASTTGDSEGSQAALQRAIQRLAPRKDRVEELFRGTTDVTKKSSLRSLLDSYIEVLNDLQEAVDDWSYEGRESSLESESSTPIHLAHAHDSAAPFDVIGMDHSTCAPP